MKSKRELQIDAWKEAAVRAEKHREIYRRRVITQPPEHLDGRVTDLTGLLNLLLNNGGLPGMYPAVQQDLYLRASSLFDEIMTEALPRRHGNAKLPERKEIERLYKDAKWILGIGFRLDTLLDENNEFTECGTEDTWERLIEEAIRLWVTTNMPLSAGQPLINTRIQKCLATVPRGEKREEKTTEGKAALELVAALLGSTADSVKKAKSVYKKT